MEEWECFLIQWIVWMEISHCNVYGGMTMKVDSVIVSAGHDRL